MYFLVYFFVFSSENVRININSFHCVCLCIFICVFLRHCQNQLIHFFVYFPLRSYIRQSRHVLLLCFAIIVFVFVFVSRIELLRWVLNGFAITFFVVVFSANLHILPKKYERFVQFIIMLHSLKQSLSYCAKYLYCALLICPKQEAL